MQLSRRSQCIFILRVKAFDVATLISNSNKIWGNERIEPKAIPRHDNGKREQTSTSN
jgi:hypothetical protein